MRHETRHSSNFNTRIPRVHSDPSIMLKTVHAMGRGGLDVLRILGLASASAPQLNELDLPTVTT